MTVKEIELHVGHFGNGTGASGHVDEVKEARKVTQKVYEILQSKRVPSTIFEDTVSKNRTQNINNLVKHHNADRDGLIVSIHFNAGGDGSKAIGTEVLYYDQKSLAEKLSKAISDATGSGLKNRGAKKRTDLGVLALTYEPAILIEVCFVNSSIDVAVYRRDFDKICQAIAKVLAEHIGYKLNNANTPVANDDIKRRAIAIIKKAVSDGTFTSPHTDVDSYTDAQLLRYVTIYSERITK